MTHHPELDDQLAAHHFSEGLNPRFIAELAALAKYQDYPAGALVAGKDDPAHWFHLLVAGRCAIEVTAAGRAPLVIATVHADEVLGWSWLLEPHTWHFDVVALDDTRTIAIDGDALRAACRADHDLGYEIGQRLAAVIASRLEATRHQLVDMYGQPH